MARDWLSFSALLEIVGVNPYVAVPASISDTFNMHSYIPVELKLYDSLFIANLVPLGNRKYRLYINGPMIKATGWKVGDTVNIQLRYDPKPRTEPVPPALTESFKAHPKAKKIFDGLNTSRRKEICRYINNLKSQEAVERNVIKVIAALEGTGTHITVRL